jgi:hypothetical protein
MATTVSDILRESLISLGQLRIAAATGGSTVTVVDSLYGGADDELIGGTLIILRDGSTVPATAPSGQFAVVSDYVASGGTISVAAADAFTESIVATDKYGVSNGKDYPHYQMLQFIDSAVKEHDIPFVDTTTIETESSKTEYGYPKAAKRQPPYRVDIQIKTTDANDNQWSEISRGLWEYVPAAADSDGLLILPQLPAGRDIRIWYKGTHSGVWDHGDVIYEGLHPNLVMWQTVLNALLWKNAQQPADENVIARLQKAEDQVFKMTAEHTIYKPPRRSKLLILGGRGYDRDMIATPDPP